MPTSHSKKPIITVDGNPSEWTAAERIDNPANDVRGYALCGTVGDDTYYIAIQSTATTDPVIGVDTTIRLNTHQNTATGYSPFYSIGTDHNVPYVNGTFHLCTRAAAQTTLVSAMPPTATLSRGGKSLEIAMPRSLVTPAGGMPPTHIHTAAAIGSGPTIVFASGGYNNPEFTIIDPATPPLAFDRADGALRLGRT